MTRDRRRVAERLGRLAETLAAAWLMAKGYSIVDRRARTPWGEIDLVARRGGVLAFVEVKARPDDRAGVEAVTGRARERQVRAAAAWRSKVGVRHAALDIRYDIVTISPWRWPSHHADAWRPEGEGAERFT